MKENEHISNLWKHAPTEFPICDENSEVACLTKVNGRYQINYYNGYFGCWDDSDGDDCQYPDSKVLDFIQLEFL